MSEKRACLEVNFIVYGKEVILAKIGGKSMDYVKFGNTGMDVSQLCLGTMGFGDPDSGFHEWVLEE